MSENVEPVRQPLQARTRSRRTLEQRLYLRFPSLAVAALRLVTRRPPSSRIRQAALRRAVEGTLEAFNRRDLEAVLIAAHPEFEYCPERDWVDAGLLEPSYRGLEGYRKFVGTVDEVWGGENYLEPLEVIDLGERWVMVANGRMRAQASGVTLSEEYVGVATLRDGLVISLQEYYNHAKGLEAVGLAPAEPAARDIAG
jgi:ketosteroid isomerase-like protein